MKGLIRAVEFHKTTEFSKRGPASMLFSEADMRLHPGGEEYAPDRGTRNRMGNRKSALLSPPTRNDGQRPDRRRVRRKLPADGCTGLVCLPLREWSCPVDRRGHSRVRRQLSEATQRLDGHGWRRRRGSCDGFAEPDQLRGAPHGTVRHSQRVGGRWASDDRCRHGECLTDGSCSLHDQRQRYRVRSYPRWR